MTRRRKRYKENRANSYGPVALSDTGNLWNNYGTTSPGIRVDNYSANCNVVFRRCVEVIATTLARLDCRLIQDMPTGKRMAYDDPAYKLVAKQANGYMTAYQFKMLLTSWSKSFGNGYAWILRDNGGNPLALFPLHPNRVVPRMIKSDNPSQPWDIRYIIDGGAETLLPYEIIHIRGNAGFDGVVGVNPVMLHENTLAQAQAENEFAGEFFQNYAQAGGFLEFPPATKPETVRKYKDDFQNAYSSRGNRHKIGFLDQGIKFTKNTIDPIAAQLLESRKYSEHAISLMLGVPPTKLGDLTHGSYSNTEQQELSFLTTTIHPEAENWGQELTLKLAPDDTYYFTFRFDSLNAADTNAKVNYYKAAAGVPWMTQEEIRIEEHMPIDPTGKIFTPVNYTAEPLGIGQHTSPDENARSIRKLKKELRRLAKVLAPKPEAPVVEARSLANRNKTLESLAPIFQDVADRLTTKECKAIRQSTKLLADGNTEGFVAKVEEFYSRHGEHIQAAYTPALTSLAHSIRHDIGDELHRDADQPSDLVALYATKMASRHVAHAKDQIANAVGEAATAGAVAAVEARLQHWANNKAENTAGYETQQAGNFFAHETYRACGIANLRWIGCGCSPECQALDGTKKPIDEPFTTEPKRMHPPMGNNCKAGQIAT